MATSVSFFELPDESGQNHIDDIVEKRLVAALKSLGLTTFSSKIAIGFIQNYARKEDGASKMARVLTYLLAFINGNQSSSCREVAPTKNWQFGCPEILHGLRASPFWNADEIPWAAYMQDAFETIRTEFMAAKKSTRINPFQPYRSPKSPGSTKQSDLLGEFATDTGDWNVCYLHLHGIDFDDNLEIFPNTSQAIKCIPRFYHHAFFSALAPGTHISPHFGPTNKKLRCMLPLIVPEPGACWLQVADQRVVLEEGKVIVFDDSFQHEAAFECATITSPVPLGEECAEEHNGGSPAAEGVAASSQIPRGPCRVVLVLDVWHPDLSDEEVRIFSFIGKAQMSAAKKMAAAYSEQQRRVCESGIDSMKGTPQDGVHVERAVGGAEGAREPPVTEAAFVCDTQCEGGELVGVRDGIEQGEAPQSRDVAVFVDAEVTTDFLSVILNARRRALVPNEAIWGAVVVDD